MKAGFGEKSCRISMQWVSTGVANYPVLTLVSTTMLSAVMVVVGYYHFEYDNDFTELITRTDSRAIQERGVLEKYFPPNSSYFSMERLTRILTLSLVGIKPLDDGSVMRKPVLSEIRRIQKDILDISVAVDGSSLTYKDICSWIRKNECFMSNIDDATNNTLYPMSFDRRGRVVKTVAFFSMPKKCGLNKVCKLGTSSVVRLMFFPRVYDERSAMVARLWQEKLADYIKNGNFSLVDVRFTTKPAMDGELTQTAMMAVDKMVCITVVVWLFCVLSGWNEDAVRWQPWLTVLGLTSMWLAVGTSCGFMLLLGVPFVPNNVAMLALLSGVGMDDTFVMINIWRQTKLSDPVPVRLKQMYSEAGVAITITSITNAACLFMSMTIPMRCYQVFSLYAGTGILVVYFYQITFFGAAIALIGRREGKNKHGWIPGVKVRPRSQTGTKGVIVRYFFTGGVNPDDPDNRLDRDKNLVQRSFARAMRKVLTGRFSALVILVFYTLYLAGAVFGVTRLKFGAKRHNMLMDDSTTGKYFDWEDRYFRDYPYLISAMLTGDIDYSAKTTQADLQELLRKFVLSKYGPHNEMATVFWLNPFLHHLTAFKRKYGDELSYDQFVRILREDFLPKTEYIDDVIFDESGTSIIASRFHFVVMNVTDVDDDRRMMRDVRRVADENGVYKLTIFNHMFLYWDQFDEVVPTTLKWVGISTTLMFVISLVFIANVSSSVWIVMVILSVEIGLVGYMSLLGVNLDPISAFIIITSVGFIVDYAAHVSYAFATAQRRGAHIDVQIQEMLERIGWPILQGAISTLLAVIPQYTAPAYLFRAVATVLMLMIVFGLLHGLFVMPTLLRLMAGGNKEHAKDQQVSDVTVRFIQNGGIIVYKGPLCVC